MLLMEAMSMRFFDLHCDTLYRALDEKKDINKGNMHVQLERAKIFKTYIGCFAAWISDNLRREKAIDLFENIYNKLESERENGLVKCESKKDLENVLYKGKIGAVFTVEGGAVLAGDISRVKKIYDYGVRAMTLTWNGSCELGDGIGVENTKGLTEFGKEAVKEMEEVGIIVDISHASERLFYDVSNIASKPFIATHSNARKICNHRRNLTDEQIRTIKSVKGLIGINFCRDFLSEKSRVSKADIIKHIEYFLSMGCEDILCIGSDFDGADMPDDIKGIESMPEIYEECLKLNYNEELVDKIFFNNAYKFFKENI